MRFVIPGIIEHQASVFVISVPTAHDRRTLFARRVHALLSQPL